jgi:SP family myo-inositol transporter-like MFS transporter 13
MYFSATIFSRIGFSSPTLTSLSIAITNFICTLIALSIIDRIGRRRILLSTLPVMICGLLLCSISYQFLDLPSKDHITAPSTPPPTSNPSPSPGPGPGPSLSAILILLALIIYVCGYAIGLGNIAWQQSELFPFSVRSVGSGIATATNWGSNFVVGLTFLPMMRYLSPTWTFVTYALICALGWLCAWRIYPETKGLGLEDVRGLLKDGWGVGESLGRLKYGGGDG